MTNLYERQAEFGIEVASGDVALERVRDGSWRARDVHVVQELSSTHGHRLCKLGATPSVLLILESPLVAYRQLDRLRRSAFRFRSCIGPTALRGQLGIQRDAEWIALRFPSLWRDQVRTATAWHARERAVLVAANKYWRQRAWSRVSSLRDGLRVIRHEFRRQLSPTFRLFRDLQLHDARLEVLEQLAQRGGVDIYGSDWDRFDHLPMKWQDRLKPLKDRFLGPCDEKIAVMMRYRFGIAFENAGYPGYLTEKIIDAMAAGTVPVYLGAPDVSDHIPASCFVDVRKVGSAVAVCERLSCMSDMEAEAIRDAGITFMRSSQGDRHTYEGFAETIISLIRSGHRKRCHG